MLSLDGNGSNVFVHYSEITPNGFRTCLEGEFVYFELVKGPKGPRAVNVHPEHMLGTEEIDKLEQACKK